MPYVVLSINKREFDQIRALLKGVFKEQNVEYFIKEKAESSRDAALIFKEKIPVSDYNVLQAILMQSLKWVK